MPFVPAPNIVKVSWFYTLNGQPAMNRIHVTTTSTFPDAALCATIAGIGRAWWVAEAAPLVHPGMILREVQALSIAQQNGPQASDVTGLPQAGTLGQAAMPGSNAFCVSLRTGLAGRSARGRWYWGGLTDQQVTDNNVDAGPAAAIVAAMAQLIADMVTTTTFPVILSYINNGDPRPGGPLAFGITDVLAVDTTVDSQRGRLH